MKNKGGLSKLLGKGEGKPKKTKKGKSKSFTLMISPETIETFNKVQWLQSVAIDYKKVNRDEILTAALEAYKKEIGFDKLMEEYRDRMPSDITPQRGR